MSAPTADSSANRSPDQGIRARPRIVLAAVGVASWACGAIAVFMNDNGAGAASLVGAGVICTALALLGRWPSRITVSGNEITWDGIKATVDSQIEAAEGTEGDDAAVQELNVLKSRLDVLERTGTVSEHPAQVYDRAVESALQRLLPGSTVSASGARYREAPDFVVRNGSQRLFVETKWRPDENTEFYGTTLTRLFTHLAPESRILVVVNTVEAAAEPARELVKEHLGDRGRVVSWRNARDDAALAEALAALTD